MFGKWQIFAWSMDKESRVASLPRSTKIGNEVQRSPFPFTLKRMMMMMMMMMMVDDDEEEDDHDCQDAQSGERQSIEIYREMKRDKISRDR